MDMVQKAMAYGLKAHAEHVRKGSGLPYFVHPMAVLDQIGDWGIEDEVIWSSAILHDVREESDGKISLSELTKCFGPKIASVVEELTFLPPKNIIDVFEIADLKQEYMDSFGPKSLSALIVKIADRCVNTCDFFSFKLDYAKKYWRKADNLFDVLSNRREEIIDAFGGEDSGVYPRIKYTQTTLCQMVA